MSSAIFQIDALTTQIQIHGLEGAPLDHLDRADGLAQHLRRFFDVVVLNKPEHDHLLLIRRQFEDSFPYLFLVKIGHEIAVQIVFRHQIDGLQIAVFPGTARPAVMINDTGMSNPVQPRQQRNLSILIFVQALHNPQKYLGGQVLRGFNAAYPVQDVAVNIMHVGIVQFAKCLLVALLSRMDEFLLALRIH